MSTTLKKLTHDQIRPSPNNIRADVGNVDELEDSIVGVGLQNPMLVRKNGDGYELIAGERRWTAIGQAITKERIPADQVFETMVRTNVDDAMQTADMLVENLHRADLTPVDEMTGFVRLANQYGWPADKISSMTGVPLSTVKSRLSWTKLPDETLATLALRQYTVEAANKLARQSAALIEELTAKGPCPSSYEIDNKAEKAKQKRLGAKVEKRLTDAGHVVTSPQAAQKAANSPQADLDASDVVEAVFAVADPPLRKRYLDAAKADEHVVAFPVGGCVFTAQVRDYGSFELYVWASDDDDDEDDKDETDEERDARALHEAWSQEQDEYNARLLAAKQAFLDSKPSTLIAWILTRRLQHVYAPDVEKVLGITDVETYAAQGTQQLAQVVAAGALRYNVNPPGWDDTPPKRKYVDVDQYDDDGNWVGLPEPKLEDFDPETDEYATALDEWQIVMHEARKARGIKA